MNLCSDGHDEICYEGQECPACLIAQDRDAFDKEIGEREKEIQELKDEIEQLKMDIEACKNDLIEGK